jgi:uncharacterized protein with HEPN domain
MLDAARLAVDFSSGIRRADLQGDPRTALAMVKAVEIVGEAASRVSSAFQDQHPEIPWADVVSMRNRLVHAYFDVDLDILWDTVAVDLPKLIRDLVNVLPMLDS